MYREDNLLYDMEAHNFTRVWDVVHTIARELSQQYFGNRVSSKWWTYQWLSEGLANLFQQIIIEMVSIFGTISTFKGCMEYSSHFVLGLSSMECISILFSEYGPQQFGRRCIGKCTANVLPC